MALLPLTDLTEFALEVALDAGRLVMDMYRSSQLAIDTKPDGSFVSAADRAAEELMREMILQRCPGDGIVGEEFPALESTTGRVWVLDPIDGTFSFVHGVPFFSNVVAVRDGSGPLAGAITAPALGEVAVAGRGIGCVVNDAPSRIRPPAKLADAVVVTSGLADYWPPPVLQQLLGSGATVRTWADGAYAYILMASGRVDAVIDASVKLWDVAAAEVIVPESGGTAGWFELAGKSGFAAATTGGLHGELLELVAS